MGRRNRIRLIIPVTFKQKIRRHFPRFVSVKVAQLDLNDLSFKIKSLLNFKVEINFSNINVDLF